MSNVYFIQASEDGPIKIGHAVNPRKRLSLLRTGSFMSLSLIAFVTSADARTEEAEIHGRLSHERVNGEWFERAAALRELAAIEASGRALIRPAVEAHRAETTPPSRRSWLGRPPRAGSTAKPVTIKATDAERTRWQLAADRESQSLSQWLRAAAELTVARGSTR